MIVYLVVKKKKWRYICDKNNFSQEEITDQNG